MVATSNRRSRIWISRPGGALILSLAAEVFFLVALGMVFLPSEAARLIRGQCVSINYCLIASDGRQALSLFWNTPWSGVSGWQHHLAIHNLDDSRPAVRSIWPVLDARCLSEGAREGAALVGDLQGRIYAIDWQRPNYQPQLIGRQSDGGVLGLACAGNGQYAVSYSGRRIYAWNLESGAPHWERELGVQCLAVIPGGRRLVCGISGGAIAEIDLDSGATLRSLPASNFQVANVAASPDGEQVAILGAAGELLVLDYRSGAPLWQVRRERPRPPACLRVATYSPCGQVLVTASPDDDRALCVWNRATGERLGTLQGHTGPIVGASFGADQRLFSWGTDGTIRSWDLRTCTAASASALMPPTRAG